MVYSALLGNSRTISTERIFDMRRASTFIVGLALASSAALAQEAKGPRFLNRTGQTVVKLQLAPTGTKIWGPDQCANDDEGEVDHNEKLTLVGVKSGRYDMRIADKNGRVCFVKNVDLREGVQFSIKEQDLTDCGK
jgi:hypothetical protein